MRSRVRSRAAVILCAARSFGWQMRVEGPTWSPFEATFLAPFLMILFIFLPIALMLTPAQFQGARAGRELCAQCKRELFFEGHHRAHNCSKSQQTKKKKGERKCHDCAQGLGASATGQSRISDIFGASAQNTGNTNALVATASPSSASASVSNASAAVVAPNSTPTLEPTPFQSAADVATRTFMETSRANQTLHKERVHHAPHDHVVAKFEEWRGRGGMRLDLKTSSSSQRVGGTTILKSVGTRVPVEFRDNFQVTVMGNDFEIRHGMQWERDGYRRPAAVAEFSFMVKVEMKDGGIDHGRPMWRAFVTNKASNHTTSVGEFLNYTTLWRAIAQQFNNGKTLDSNAAAVALGFCDPRFISLMETTVLHFDSAHSYDDRSGRNQRKSLQFIDEELTKLCSTIDSNDPGTVLLAYANSSHCKALRNNLKVVVKEPPIILNCCNPCLSRTRTRATIRRGYSCYQSWQMILATLH